MLLVARPRSSDDVPDDDNDGDDDDGDDDDGDDDGDDDDDDADGVGMRVRPLLVLLMETEVD